MKYLVECSCGHSLERHDMGGCAGEGGAKRCDCRRDQTGALDTAIAAARSESAMPYSLFREDQAASAART